MSAAIITFPLERRQTRFTPAWTREEAARIAGRYKNGDGAASDGMMYAALILAMTQRQVIQLVANGHAQGIADTLSCGAAAIRDHLDLIEVAERRLIWAATEASVTITTHSDGGGNGAA